MLERARSKGGGEDLVHSAVAATGDDTIHAALPRAHDGLDRKARGVATFPCDANLDLMTVVANELNRLSYPRVLRGLSVKDEEHARHRARSA
ncbi:hypothetical protein GCM10009087_27930 [Sphingomonas oligophenolica]